MSRGAVRNAASLPRTGGILGGRVLFEAPDGSADDTITVDTASLTLSKDCTIAVIYKGYSAPTVQLSGGDIAEDITVSGKPADAKEVDGYKLFLLPLKGTQIPAKVEKLTLSGATGYTVYEISILGLPASNPETTYTYRVNGNAYASSKDATVKKPTPEGFKFLGWYTSPKYTPGTEFNGTIHEGARTVYAKLELASFKPVKVSVTPAPLPVISPRQPVP